MYGRWLALVLSQSRSLVASRLTTTSLGRGTAQTSRRQSRTLMWLRSGTCRASGDARDVLLGEVAGDRDHRRVVGQSGVDRGEVLVELVKQRTVRCHVERVGGDDHRVRESTIAWPLWHW